VPPPPNRPLKLSELVAETIRLYGDRPAASLGLGAVVAGAFLLAGAAPALLEVLILSLAFTLSYAAAARLASGDSFPEAWAQVALRLPVLAILTLIVAVPFALAVGFLLLLIFAVLWLALSGFSIPVAMLEREADGSGAFGRLSHALDRSLRLARAEYLHAAGVAAALVLIYLVFGILIGGALTGFADNSETAAVALVQLVLSPFFFLGLSVLYFEQRARVAERAPAEPSERAS
jgi:hypothetical protein